MKKALLMWVGSVLVALSTPPQEKTSFNPHKPSWFKAPKPEHTYPRFETVGELGAQSPKTHVVEKHHWGIKDLRTNEIDWSGKEHKLTNVLSGKVTIDEEYDECIKEGNAFIEKVNGVIEKYEGKRLLCFQYTHSPRSTRPSIEEWILIFDKDAPFLDANGNLQQKFIDAVEKGTLKLTVVSGTHLDTPHGLVGKRIRVNDDGRWYFGKQWYWGLGSTHKCTYMEVTNIEIVE